MTVGRGGCDTGPFYRPTTRQHNDASSSPADCPEAAPGYSPAAARTSSVGHNTAVPSRLAESTVRPSGEKATDVIA